MRLKLRHTALAIATGLACGTQPASAYPIDCAIFLCLAGGFPASAECSAAKAVMIRRITPWPIEPPLQLWNCPMGMSSQVASILGTVEVGPDGLTPDIRQYRDGIEIYHIIRYVTYSRDEGRRIIDHTAVGLYDSVGAFSWRGANFAGGPAWLADATGGRREPVASCENGDDRARDCDRYGSVNYENAAGSLRGIAMRTRDYQNKYHVTWAPY